VPLLFTPLLPDPCSFLLLVFNLAVDYRFGHALAMKLLLFVLLGLPGILLAQGGLPNQPVHVIYLISPTK
jgi:hypothetical protein